MSDPSSAGTVRAAAFGRQLVEVHDWLRKQLADLRTSLVDGSVPAPRDLRMHCLTFCSALTRHHTGEDDAAFPALATEVPELADVLAQLRQDHDMITTLMADFHKALANPDATPETLRRHIDGLSAIVESHFAFEERKITTALDNLKDPGWGKNPGFLRST